VSRDKIKTLNFGLLKEINATADNQKIAKKKPGIQKLALLSPKLSDSFYG
jgi:hypothetical protein